MKKSKLKQLQATISDFTSLSTKDITLVRIADQPPEFKEECCNMPLCDTDARESLAIVGDSVRETVRFAVNTPTAHAGIVKGRVRGIFGVHGQTIWMLSDGYFKDHYPVQMHKIALGVVKAVKNTPELVVQNVTLPDSPNVRWLESLGFRFMSLKPDLLYFYMVGIKRK